MKRNTNSPVVLDAFDAKYIKDVDGIITGWKLVLSRNPILSTLYGEIVRVKIDGFEYLAQVANSYQTDNSLVNRVELRWIKRSKQVYFYGFEGYFVEKIGRKLDKNLEGLQEFTLILQENWSKNG